METGIILFRVAAILSGEVLQFWDVFGLSFLRPNALVVCNTFS
jgi:hypothetical protein